jgi:hypothetical protein
MDEMERIAKQYNISIPLAKDLYYKIILMRSLQMYNLTLFGNMALFLKLNEYTRTLTDIDIMGNYDNNSFDRIINDICDKLGCKKVSDLSDYYDVPGIKNVKLLLDDSHIVEVDYKQNKGLEGIDIAPIEFILVGKLREIAKRNDVINLIKHMYDIAFIDSNKLDYKQIIDYAKNYEDVSIPEDILIFCDELKGSDINNQFKKAKEKYGFKKDINLSNCIDNLQSISKRIEEEKKQQKTY